MALYHHVIVPLDGSELSAQALPVACTVAGKGDAGLTLVRSYMPVPSWQVNAEQGRYLGSLAAAEHDRVAAYLNMARQELEKQGITQPIDVEATEGFPVTVITDLAGRHPDAVIVMSTHGHGGIKRLMTGSITSQVVGSVSNPVLVVRNAKDDGEGVNLNFANIIVPLDGSAFAEPALDYAVELSQLLGAELTLCQSSPDSEYFQSHTDWSRLNGEGGFDLGGPREMSERQAELAHNYLTHTAHRVKEEHGLGEVNVSVFKGDAADAIVKLAGELDDAMVVMTTHGRSGVGRALLGSVADRVVRGSPAPTLLLRSPDSVAGQHSHEDVVNAEA